MASIIEALNKIPKFKDYSINELQKGKLELPPYGYYIVFSGQLQDSSHPVVFVLLGIVDVNTVAADLADYSLYSIETVEKWNKENKIWYLDRFIIRF